MLRRGRDGDVLDARGLQRVDGHGHAHGRAHCRPQVHYRHVQLRRIRKVPRVLFVSFMVQMLLRLGDGGITAMITPSPPAPSSVHSPIAARRSTRLLVVPTYRSDLV